MFPSGLDPDEFREALAGYAQRYTAVHLLIGPVDGEQKPIGIGMLAGPELASEVHIEWFPWASPRNRVTMAVNYVNRLRRDRLILTTVLPDLRRWGEMFCRYGIARRIGTIEMPDGQRVPFYQSRAAKED